MIGKTISHYKILEKLGEGGMGVVYKAEDTKLERTVALKFLSPQSLGTEEDKTRFVREARAAAALSHPNICTIHEIDEADDQAFIAMEHIDGRSLEEIIETGPLQAERALEIIVQVGNGLRHAHNRGIVHRDIKPANIMVAEDGQAKIMDFGLAKLAGRSRLTGTATIMGTVAYMSPEQAHGDTEIDHRTDIWSLGVVLHEMLTGKLPFDAPTDAGVIHKIIYEDPAPMTDRREDTPIALERTVGKMLRKAPRDRYENMEALIDDLKAVKSETAAAATRESPSIAVLPFVNMSADPEQEYFCDGLAEELINELTQIKDLRVVARTSAFSFKGRNVHIRDIGRELNVETILEGSVRKAGNQLRITAQLVKVADGYHLWSEKFDRELENIFVIQDQITLAIVDKLKPRLFGEEKAKLVKHKTVDLEAYTLCLKGRWFWHKRTAAAFEKAIEHFRKAIEKAPDYALAYSGLADTYSALSLYGPFPPRETFPKAQEAVLKAVELDNSLAEAHASMGAVKGSYEWDWEGCEKEYRRAIELNPGYATAHHFLAVHLLNMGRFEEAFEEIARARELDPLCLHISRNIGMFYYYARQYDRAIEALQKTIEMDPNYSAAHAYLGNAYMQKSMYNEAIAEYEKEKVVSEGLNHHMQIAIGIVYAKMNEVGKGRQILSDLLEQSRDTYISSSILAELCFSLGENDKGFELLNTAYEERDTWLGWLKIDQAYDSVRSDPRFVAMLKKMNLDNDRQKHFS